MTTNENLEAVRRAAARVLLISESAGFISTKSLESHIWDSAIRLAEGFQELDSRIVSGDDNPWTPDGIAASLPKEEKDFDGRVEDFCSSMGLPSLPPFPGIRG